MIPTFILLFPLVCKLRPSTTGKDSLQDPRYRLRLPAVQSSYNKLSCFWLPSRQGVVHARLDDTVADSIDGK
ncbi:hypothetical protein COCCADRAFT_110174 [Bipolaris zeicola 26-R-13]|uniref:Secreted protein n=1 Tax=Cochliobolus carbonum (strain 26-R-13) TaxID=930089 RepID=W6XLC2_COCC2|nr:uncharacterized protein COCCADRAFT_110174 [Bipolaris zeicola 26-R-13]EUC28037.1 hypothetical protein COCCADRAFT_110174 [Bipolaris zeicola 26-R-13]